jgi:hypothetical protein
MYRLPGTFANKVERHPGRSYRSVSHQTLGNTEDISFLGQHLALFVT